MKEFLIDCYRGVSAGRHRELVARTQLCAVKGDDSAPSTGHKGKWCNYKTQLCTTEQLIASNNHLNKSQLMNWSDKANASVLVVQKELSFSQF